MPVSSPFVKHESTSSSSKFFLFRATVCLACALTQTIVLAQNAFVIILYIYTHNIYVQNYITITRNSIFYACTGIARDSGAHGIGIRLKPQQFLCRTKNSIFKFKYSLANCIL